MPTNRKRIGLNSDQIRVLESIRNLPEATVARMAREAKKILGLKHCFPRDISVAPYLFQPADLEDAGYSSYTIGRYTEYLLGIARKKDEHEDVYRDRLELFDHSYAPLVYDASGKIFPRWKEIRFPKHIPSRLISERLLIFIVLGITTVKGKNAPKKRLARKRLADLSEIPYAKIRPILPDDEVRYWNSVTRQVEDPQVRLFPEAKVPSIEEDPPEIAQSQEIEVDPPEIAQSQEIEVDPPEIAQPPTASETPSDPIPFAPDMDSELSDIGAILRTMAGKLDQIASAGTRVSELEVTARVDTLVAEHLSSLDDRETELARRETELAQRAEMIAQKEAILRQLLSALDAGKTAGTPVLGMGG